MDHFLLSIYRYYPIHIFIYTFIIHQTQHQYNLKSRYFIYKMVKLSLIYYECIRLLFCTKATRLYIIQPKTVPHHPSIKYTIFHRSNLSLKRCHHSTKKEIQIYTKRSIDLFRFHWIVASDAIELRRKRIRMLYVFNIFLVYREDKVLVCFI